MNSVKMPKRWIANTLRIYLLPNAVLIALSLASLISLSGCASRQPVQVQCPVPAQPAAWAMQEPQNLTSHLDKIIYVSSED